MGESERVDQDLDDWDFVPSIAIHLLGDLRQVNSPLFTSCRMGTMIVLEVLGGLQYSS